MLPPLDGVKVVFLDIDGVLNNLGSVLAYGNPSKYLDMVSVRLVERLCKHTEAKIVISSSWRIGRTVEQLKNELDSLMAHRIADRIIGRTGDGYNGHRGRQIKEWIEVNAPDCTFVILDDDSDMLPAQKPFFVKTTFEDGFRAAHYKKAMAILDPQSADSKIITMAEYDPEAA
jgi:hypothetical protein